MLSRWRRSLGSFSFFWSRKMTVSQGLKQFLPLVVLGLSLWTAPQVLADAKLGATYDWVLQLDTKTLDRQFQYQGSTLKNIEKIQVQYYPAKDDSHKTDYEYLWFTDGKALGMEKQRKFDLPQGEGVALIIKHAKPTATVEEKKATANAIMRLALDSLLNKNPINTVELPASSFVDIANELQNQGFMEAPDDPNDFGGGFSPNITLYLHSEPAGQKITLYR